VNRICFGRSEPASPIAQPDRAGERGIVLLVVLVVVALLTIIVTEFTYSVQIDQHRARNAIYSLQANMLARSGINIAESFIALDDPPEANKYDAKNDEWVLLMLDFFDQSIQVGEGMRLRPEVIDESGKINVNLSRPTNKQPLPPGQPNLNPDAFVRDAMRVIFQNHNINLDIIDSLPDYWAKEVRDSSGRVNFPQDFGSLEEFAGEFRIPTRKLNRLRRVLTALPVRAAPQDSVRKINANTASEEVLAALFGNLSDGGGEAVSMVLERQQEDPPFQSDGDVRSLLTEAGIQGQELSGLMRILGVKSDVYRIRASAVVNANFEDETSRGGIGQTLSVLVRRKPTKQPLPETGKRGWTFQALDWQKEGGARLLDEPSDDELDEAGAPSDDEDEDDEDEDW